MLENKQYPFVFFNPPIPSFLILFFKTFKYLLYPSLWRWPEMKHSEECCPELSSDQGEEEEVCGRVEYDEQVVEGDGDHDPEGRAEGQAHLGARADLGQAANVVDVEEQLAEVAEQEGED